MRRKKRQHNLNEWPAASALADCLGAVEVRGGVAQWWSVDQRCLYFVHRLPGWDPQWDDWAEQLPNADAVVGLAAGFSIDGPTLGVFDDSADRGFYELPWPKLSEILGQPIPYWADGLRGFEAINTWRPEDPKQILIADPVLDVECLLRLAMTLPEPHHGRDALIAFARLVQDRATEYASRDIETIREHVDPQTVTIAAEPLPTSDSSHQEVDESIQRALWMEILRRTDDLARAAVRTALEWNHGQLFPYSSVLDVEPVDPVFTSWSQRLEPTMYTVAFEIFAGKDIQQTLIDPDTDAPVIVDTDGNYRMAVPRYLPSMSRMTEIVLGDRGRVWIGTNDSFYIAPEGSSGGVRWGGGGSSTDLANLIDQLLDEEKLLGLNRGKRPPEGLLAVARHKWTPGTVLTREQLEDARNGKLPPEIGNTRSA